MFLIHQERLLVHSSLLNSPGREKVILLSHSEVHSFAGNCFELKNDKGELFLAISKRAWDVSRILPDWHLSVCSIKSLITFNVSFQGLAAEGPSGLEKQMEIRSGFKDVLVCDVSEIEHVGGGGIRCMIAGNHLSDKK